MIAFIVAALVPVLVGMIWYNPKVMGNIWMKECGFTLEDTQKDFKPLKVFGLSLLFSLMLSFFFQSTVLHQSGIYSLLADRKRLTPEQITSLDSAFASAKNLYRDFGHGAFHGILFAIFIVLPIIGINGQFEKRSWKYILVHVGYWILTLGIMGGILCQWSGVFDEVPK